MKTAITTHQITGFGRGAAHLPVGSGGTGDSPVWYACHRLPACAGRVPRVPRPCFRHTILFTCVSCVILSVAPFAKADSLADMLANLGNVGMNGLPNLAFDLVEHPLAAEIKSLGFDFKLRHQVVPAHGRKARSDWQIPALTTAVYMDSRGDLIWLNPRGQTVKFRKSSAGFDRSTDGSSASVSLDGAKVEIATARSVIWRYQDGFIESLQVRNQRYFLKTDRETILSISDGVMGKPLLEINYSATGHLSEIVFADGKKCLLQWTPDNCLEHITGDAGPELAFEYDDLLLKNWRVNDGPLHEFTWMPADPVFRLVAGTPPVRLVADSLFTYRWSRGGGVDILTVFRKSGAFVSRTRFGPRGIEQETPYETLRFAYKTTSIP